MNNSKDASSLATGADLICPVLGIPGLPDHITKFAITLDAEDFIEITCSFLVEKTMLGDLERSWKPMFSKYRLLKVEDGAITADPDTGKHPAEKALEKLRDYPEICEARGESPHQFRKYARPIIDAYFAPLGEKLCRTPVTLEGATPEQLRQWDAESTQLERTTDAS